ncbi:MAG: hypothetical protein CL600_03520 [Alteromonas sp.]|nr:hypothetical protein [Alteromonas sp.]
MKIACVTPLHPGNKFNGASQRIMKVVLMLKMLGHQVKVIYTCQDNFENIDNNRIQSMEKRITQVLGCDEARVIPSKVKIKNRGKLNLIDDYYPDDIIKKIKSEVEMYASEVVWVNYVFLSKIFEVFDSLAVVKVLDTHDRLARAEEYKKAGTDLGFFCTTEVEEKVGIQRADIVLCIQEHEKRYFESQGAKFVQTIGHYRDSCYMDGIQPKRNLKFGFIGSNHVFNSKSIDEIVNEVLKHTELRNLEFVFAGGICDNPVIKELPNVKLLGRVEREMDFYENVDVILNPVFFGTGLKIKTVDSLAFGKPVIGTNVAFDGLNSPSNFHNAKTAEDFVMLVKGVLENPSRVLSLANLSKSLFESYSQSVIDSYKNLFKAIEFTSKKEEGKRTFYHHVNFVEVGGDSDLSIAQPITLHSFVTATERTVSAKVKYAVYLVGDEQVFIPNELDHVKLKINETVRSVPSFENCKPLPFLKSLFANIESYRDDDVIIYTNADISVSPDFYDFLSQKFDEGFDALVVNRKTLSRKYAKISDFDEMLKDKGKSHPGFDCFAVQAKYFKKFYFANVLIGVHLIGRVLLWNIAKYCKKIEFIPTSDLTFHIGDDNSGKDESSNKLVSFNMSQAIEVLKNLGVAQVLELEKYIKNSTKILYKPNILRPNLYLNKPVLIHSMFRTGSSYFYAKLQQQNNLNCFYEPLHETLASLTQENIVYQSNVTAKYHTRLGDKGYWQDFSTLIPKNGKGVSNYTAKFAYCAYYDNSKIDRDLISYLESLLNHAISKQKRPVLQFNRTGVRQRKIADSIPNSFNIYLLRDHKTQFTSYYDSYLKNNKTGFLRTMLATVLLNQDLPQLEDLVNLVPKIREFKFKFKSVKNFFDEGDEAIKSFNLNELYTIFLYEWYFSLSEALNHNCIVINMDKLSMDVVYRRSIEKILLDNYIYLDLDDCNLPTRSVVSSVISNYEDIEKNVAKIFENINSDFTDNSKCFSNVMSNTGSLYYDGNAYQLSVEKGVEVELSDILSKKSISDYVKLNSKVIVEVFFSPLENFNQHCVFKLNGKNIYLRRGSSFPVAIINQDISIGSHTQLYFSDDSLSLIIRPY